MSHHRRLVIPGSYIQHWLSFWRIDVKVVFRQWLSTFWFNSRHDSCTFHCQMGETLPIRYIILNLVTFLNRHLLCNNWCLRDPGISKFIIVLANLEFYIIFRIFYLSLRWPRCFYLDAVVDLRLPCFNFLIVILLLLRFFNPKGLFLIIVILGLARWESLYSYAKVILLFLIRHTFPMSSNLFGFSQLLKLWTVENERIVFQYSLGGDIGILRHLQRFKKLLLKWFLPLL